VFFITLLVGWMMSEGATMEEFGMGNNLACRSWGFDMRYLTSMAIGLISLMSIVATDLMATWTDIILRAIAACPALEYGFFSVVSFSSGPFATDGQRYASSDIHN
jgi:hypothetical protein